MRIKLIDFERGIEFKFHVPCKNKGKEGLHLKTITGKKCDIGNMGSYKFAIHPAASDMSFTVSELSTGAEIHTGFHHKEDQVIIDATKKLMQAAHVFDNTVKHVRAHLQKENISLPVNQFI